MNENGTDPVAFLAAELQDAHLVIGRQQVTLLRLEQANQELQRRLHELEQQQEPAHA